MESHAQSAHSALGFRESHAGSVSDSPHSPRSAHSAIGLVASRCSGGSRSVARMRTGEVFLTRSRLADKPPDPDVDSDSDESPPLTRKGRHVSDVSWFVTSVVRGFVTIRI